MKSNLIFVLILSFFFLLATVGAWEEEDLTDTDTDSDDNYYDVEVIKNRAWEGYQTDIGAHYYAYSPYSTEYSTVTTFVKLPKLLNTNGGKRKATISLGVAGLKGAIEIGITNNGEGWFPCYYDTQKKQFHSYKIDYPPYGVEIIAIQIDVKSNRYIYFYFSYRRASLKVVKSFQDKVDASHIIVKENSRPKFRFFRFAKLATNNVEDPNDGTYMIGAQFTELTIVKNGSGKSWGINSDDIDVAWKVYSKRIPFSYDARTDKFDIKNSISNDKLSEEELKIFRALPELRFSSLAMKLPDNENTLKLKMKVPFDDCFEFSSQNAEVQVYIYSTSGDIINLKSGESCYSFEKGKILYILIKTKAGGNIWVPLKFKQYKNYLPYQPLDKDIDYDTSDDDKDIAKPFEIIYEKRKGEGEGLYINCNNPEKLYEQDINKPIIRNRIENKEVFFTMEHFLDFKGGYMGYRVKNIGEDDLYITVRNLGYYRANYGGDDWYGQKEWIDFYNVNFRFRNKERLTNEELNILNNEYKLLFDDYITSPKVPITYRIPSGKYIYVLGGTSEDAFNNINVFDTADMKFEGGVVNGAVLFDVKGSAEASLYYYTKYQDINDNDHSSEYLINDIDYLDIDHPSKGAQYKGYEDVHGVVDGYVFWKFNDNTEPQSLPVKIINNYKDGEIPENPDEAYSLITDSIQHEHISNSWITNSNPQNSTQSESTIGSDLIEFNIYDSKFREIKIDNFHFDGRGKIANTANWMISYITSYYLVNLGDREREVTVSFYGHGIVAGFVVNSDGHIIGDTEQFSLYYKDKDSGKEIIHEFIYTTKIKPKEKVKFYVEHLLLANSNGKVIHKAELK